MVLVPLTAGLVAAVFAVHLARQFVQGRRPHTLAWALALGLYAVGSAAVRTRRWTVVLIALGVMIVAGDSLAIRAGNGALFSFLLAAGITVMYAGFLATTRPSRPAAAAAGPARTSP